MAPFSDRHYPLGKSLVYQLGRRLDGSKCHIGHSDGDRKNRTFLPEVELRFITLLSTHNSCQMLLLQIASNNIDLFVKFGKMNLNSYQLTILVPASRDPIFKKLVLNFLFSILNKRKKACEITSLCVRMCVPF